MIIDSTTLHNLTSIINLHNDMLEHLVVITCDHAIIVEVEVEADDGPYSV